MQVTFVRSIELGVKKYKISLNSTILLNKILTKFISTVFVDKKAYWVFGTVYPEKMEAENPLSLSTIKQEKENLEDNLTEITVDGSLFVDTFLDIKEEPEFIHCDEFNANYSCHSIKCEEDSISCNEGSERKNIKEENKPSHMVFTEKVEVPFISVGELLHDKLADNSDKNPQNRVINSRVTNATEKSVTCAECQSSFSDLSKLRTHMTIHTGEKPFSCSECHSTFTRMYHLKTHMRSHTGEKPFVCSVCNRGFSRSSRLKNHMRIHTGEKPFSCSICQRCFTLARHLKIHMRTHTGEKPYICTECKRSFSHKDNLKIHMRNHTGERPFKCSECPKGYSRLSSLKIHLRTHTGEKPFTCKECQTSFSLSHHLKRHMKIHTG
ncbi:gastrula zinc finger protein XlCGF8.2DB-like isoform X2 [Palaemon carinicauda]|uniref:gastrula zinc finger protein XlCGF8.2DB-like isoform X2 n=1 Tax=Palaemon carinicauda TaxID=392227 RepID=UPI0035B627C6